MIKISDMTMRQSAEGFSLSFREKIELSKLLDKLGTTVIEVEGLHGSRTDALRIKSIAAAVNDSIVITYVKAAHYGTGIYIDGCGSYPLTVRSSGIWNNHNISAARICVYT